MENMSKISIQFENESLKNANIKAKELLIELENQISDIDISIERESETFQDAGSILIIALSSPVLVAIINVLKVYLKKRYSSSLTIKFEDLNIEINNVSSKTINDILKNYPQITIKND